MDGFGKPVNTALIEPRMNQPAEIATTSAISNIDVCFGPVYRIYSWRAKIKLAGAPHSFLH